MSHDDVWAVLFVFALLGGSLIGFALGRNYR